MKNIFIIKVLDGSYTNENHRSCVDASRPLIEAVNELHTYALSKEFSSTPSTISSTVSLYSNKKI